MKSISILTAVILLFSFCDNNRQKDIEQYSTITYEDCEYLTNNQKWDLCHKGNCKNPLHESIKPRSYQMQINSDSTAILYDGNKVAGRFKFIRTQLDTIIMNDNK